MRLRLLPAMIAATAACTVGPGGSFPDSGSATAVTNVSSTTPVTASASGTSDDTGNTGESGDTGSTGASDDGTGASSDSGAGTTDPSADESSTSPITAAESSDSGAGTSLDPQLDIPDGGEQCDYPGDLNSCPGISVCRFATVEYGLCESCDACGNLNAPCVQGTDCDILFSCYAGRCTNFCTLGSFECGPVDACLDVGHPTRGVCDPFA